MTRRVTNDRSSPRFPNRHVVELCTGAAADEGWRHHRAAHRSQRNAIARADLFTSVVIRHLGQVATASRMVSMFVLRRGAHLCRPGSAFLCRFTSVTNVDFMETIERSLRGDQHAAFSCSHQSPTFCRHAAASSLKPTNPGPCCHHCRP